MNIFNLISLFGGLAMFLYGMNVMGDSLEKIGGGKFERILEKLTSNPIKGVLLGAGVTAIIQSSSATTVMVVGFVNSGIMQLHQAVGIIMGANIGTTATAWILSLSGIQGDSLLVNCFKPENFTPVLALIGIILIMFSKKDKKKTIGTILIGFSVLMFGMEQMSGAVEPLKDVPEFTNILTMFRNPILGVLAGTVLTAVIQSSSASVGILQALSSTGAITFGAAIPIIMGQNIGTCATALISCIGANKNAKRAAIVHLYFNIIGTILFLTIFYTANSIVHFEFVNDTVNAANIAVVHSLFNILATAVLLPFNKLLEKVATLTIREGASNDMFSTLDERFLNTPSFAIEKCMALTVDMGKIAKETYDLAVECMNEYSEKSDEKIIANENLADEYEDALGSYLVKISTKNLNDEDSEKVSLLLHAIGDIEQITDYSANILFNARFKNDKNYSFSDKAKTEIKIMTDAVDETLDTIISSIANNDIKKAVIVEPLEEVIDTLKTELKNRHIRRIQEGKCTVEMGFMFTDYISALEKISDHCANIAGTMIELNSRTYDVHQYMTELKNSDKYKEMYAKYATKYALPYSVPASLRS